MIVGVGAHDDPLYDDDLGKMGRMMSAVPYEVATGAVGGRSVNPPHDKVLRVLQNTQDFAYYF